MSRLSMNFTGPEPRSRRRPLTALFRLIFFGACMGAVAILTLHVLGVRL
jgi:hypothetical protein